MYSLRQLIGSIIRIIKNRIFYLKKKKFIKEFFKEHYYTNTKPFNLPKWHHDLYLFTAKDQNNESIFIKLTNLERLLKNENRAYKKFQKDEFLKTHLIERKGYIKKDGYKALILKRAKGTVLTEDWMIKNIDKLHILIKIIDKFAALSLVHRDIKLDNFIYEDGQIKVFDFSFMIDKTENKKLKEIDLTNNENMIKLVTMGVGYKPAPLKWDDYYALHVIFNSLAKNNSLNISLEQKEMLFRYCEECRAKIGTNNYTINK